MLPVGCQWPGGMLGDPRWWWLLGPLSPGTDMASLACQSACRCAGGLVPEAFPCVPSHQQGVMCHCPPVLPPKALLQLYPRQGRPGVPISGLPTQKPAGSGSSWQPLCPPDGNSWAFLQLDQHRWLWEPASASSQPVGEVSTLQQGVESSWSYLLKHRQL